VRGEGTSVFARLALTSLATAVLVAYSLAARTLPAHAQTEWVRQVSESGPVGPVVIGTLGSAFWAPLPSTVPYIPGTVGIPEGPPQEIVRGQRGEDLFFTLPPAFRRPAPARTPPVARPPESPPTLGRGDAYNCGDFRSQADAQAVLRADPTDPFRLDTDRDGIACESNRAPYDRNPVPRR
jgi:hypothetical protein